MIPHISRFVKRAERDFHGMIPQPMVTYHHKAQWVPFLQLSPLKRGMSALADRGIIFYPSGTSCHLPFQGRLFAIVPYTILPKTINSSVSLTAASSSGRGAKSPPLIEEVPEGRRSCGEGVGTEIITPPSHDTPSAPAVPQMPAGAAVTTRTHGFGSPVSGWDTAGVPCALSRTRTQRP